MINTVRRNFCAINPVQKFFTFLYVKETLVNPGYDQHE